MTVLLIDNYDSFTWNLAHLIGGAGREVRVHRNDRLTPEAVVAMRPEAIIISPGPCTPDDAGITLSLVPAAEEAGIPLLGVCLGHQAICQAHGGTVVRANRLMHGKTSAVTHDQSGVLAGLPSPFTAARYHSLTVREADLPARVRITARAADDEQIMAITVDGTRTHGVQFHPESIASEHGAALIANFLKPAPRRLAA